MRLTLRICILPLLAGLICTAFACEDGSTPAVADSGGQGGGEQTTGSGGSSSTTEVVGTGGATTTTTDTEGAAGATTTTATATATCWDFAKDTEYWKKNYAMVHDMTDKTLRDETASTALLEGTTGDWIDETGYGGPNGYVKLTIPVNETQSDFQSLVYSLNAATTPLKMKGKTVTAFVKAISGLSMDDSSNPSGAKLFLKSGSTYMFADGGWNNLLMNDWVKISITADSPTYADDVDPALFDADDIYELGIQIDTSGSVTTLVTPGIVMIDHVCYE